jgi:hypothetical protein
MMNVPETTLRDSNLLSKSDLGAWQVAFQSSKCIDGKYIKYLLFTCLSSSGHHLFFREHPENMDKAAEICHTLVANGRIASASFCMRRG